MPTHNLNLSLNRYLSKATISVESPPSSKRLPIFQSPKIVKNHMSISKDWSSKHLKLRRIRRSLRKKSQNIINEYPYEKRQLEMKSLDTSPLIKASRVRKKGRGFVPKLNLRKPKRYPNIRLHMKHKSLI
mmetsp:Transcript_4713/g.3970  ORF Transcript_4713/g.3970 Transcript_4713/m.3970 type:complete len:130 (+) Transcript_4713:523-912(+)